MELHLGDDVLWMEVHDGVVIFNPTTGLFTDLNQSAGELWTAMSRGSWSEIAAIEHLEDAGRVGRGEALRILGKFLSDLEDLGILLRRPIDR